MYLHPAYLARSADMRANQGTASNPSVTTRQLSSGTRVASETIQAASVSGVGAVGACTHWIGAWGGRAGSGMQSKSGMGSHMAGEGLAGTEAPGSVQWPSRLPVAAAPSHHGLAPASSSGSGGHAPSICSHAEPQHLQSCSPPRQNPPTTDPRCAFTANAVPTVLFWQADTRCSAGRVGKLGQCVRLQSSAAEQASRVVGPGRAERAARSS